MTTKHPVVAPTDSKGINDMNITMNLSQKDCSDIRNNPLYKGQLSYIKEILLASMPNLDEDILAERLDISREAAHLLLYDCHNSFEDEEG
ncbi:MAG: hypothetical protein FK733_13165 [Asgard group archaeon]|nr:hypothetical protein [Asgard group archaeon]